jgi:hypothetical protein
MKVTLQSIHKNVITDHPASERTDPSRVQLVLCFGAKICLMLESPYRMLREKYPAAQIVMCSTAGEIFGTTVLDDSITVTAIEFASTKVQAVSVVRSEFRDCADAANGLMNKLDLNGLRYVLVLADGSKVNGTWLINGINQITKGKILVTGGLAGDGISFQSTLAGLNEEPREGKIIAVGFYGDKFTVRHGSKGGWETFGPERKVTKSSSNILFGIDGRPALELYKRYLGPDADNLPASALLFPLSVNLPDSDESVVRTILSIDEASGSMTFAGDIPEGASVRFMRANFDKLTLAASGAAQQTLAGQDEAPELALLISCVGRKAILKMRTEEELEAVDEVFGRRTKLTGFYSYGELSPLSGKSECRLHNQTMTITTLHESE